MILKRMQYSYRIAKMASCFKAMTKKEGSVTLAAAVVMEVTTTTAVFYSMQHSTTKQEEKESDVPTLPIPRLTLLRRHSSLVSASLTLQTLR